MDPFLIAAFYGNKELCEQLIANGANVNVKDKYGVTALMRAARYDNGLCELLISRGADVNTVSDHGDTVLLYACFHYNFRLCELLINYGADINSENRKHYSALRSLVDTRNKNLCELLILKGARLKIGGYLFRKMIKRGWDDLCLTAIRYNSFQRRKHLLCCWIAKTK